ncbi:MAG: MFS transporter [Acidimicrobiales bacterium]|nr:sugar porter family MFS transporter [Hyphomonadaceae bacterium]RZV37087.1 MAG: MFS transporter [Acidimicrobiales bacterium]
MTDQSNADSGSFLFVLVVSVIATLGGFLFGYDSGVINGTVEGLQTAFNSKDVGTGFSVSSMLLGSAIGALAAGTLSDRFGRKRMLFVAAILFIISAWGSGIASDSGQFIMYRLIGGMAVGAASVMAPAYISEIAPAHIRGRLASIQQVAIIVGLTVAFISNYFLAKISGSALAELWGGFETWRWMFWMELIPATIFLIALFFIPESPRFEVANDKKDSALKTLSKVIGAERAADKITEIAHSLVADHKPRLADAMDKGRIFRPIVWVGIGLAVFQQLVGINIVFYYGAVLWQAVGFAEDQALLINILSGSLSIAAVLITLSMIDKIGRKPFLVLGSFGMFVTLGLVAIAFGTGSLENGTLQLSDQMALLALISANAYVFFFNLSWGPVMWVMLGEMFPNQFRGSGLAVAGFAQWIANFCISWSFLPLLGGIGLAATYGIYAAFAFISIFFVLWFVKETKGKELEEMQG